MKTFTTTPSHLLLLNVTVRILKLTRAHQTVMDRYVTDDLQYLNLNNITKHIFINLALSSTHCIV